MIDPTYYCPGCGRLRCACPPAGRYADEVEADAELGADEPDGKPEADADGHALDA